MTTTTTTGGPAGDTTGRSVRDASRADAAACAAIYAPYVCDTAVSFEAEPPTPAQMAERITAAHSTHAWLVLVDDGQVTGYCYGGPFRSRQAYQWTCEVSVYLAPGRHRKGGGRLLYTALLTRLADRGYQTAVAAMTLPNDASVGLHQAMGFTPVGTFHHVGHKHRTWHDVAWVERALSPTDPDPAPPR